MAEIITVPTGGKGIIDFSRDEALYTVDLEACLAVGGVYENKGALMHLRQIDPVDEFVGWFSKEIPVSGSNIYLVGGREGRAEHFVDHLRAALGKYGYNKLNEKVLTIFHIDMRLRREGVDLTCNRQWGGPLGLEYIPVNSYTL